VGRVETPIEHAEPAISVVIPSRDGTRGGNVDRLLADLRSQTRQDFEVILAIGFSPNGHARNQGVKPARGKYLVCIDDDVTLGHERVLENLIKPFVISDFRFQICDTKAPGGEGVGEGLGPQRHGEPREGQGRNAKAERGEGAEKGGRADQEQRTTDTLLQTAIDGEVEKSAICSDPRGLHLQSAIGMTGPSQLIPPSQPRWVHWAARQLPRSLFPVVDQVTDSDMVSHMCLCMPTQLYKDVGWENDEIVRGTDTDLRFRVRKAGYRIVVVPDTWAYHPLPDTPRKLLKMWFDKGKWTAYNRRHFPGFHFEAPDGPAKDFVPLRSTRYRVVRYAFRVLTALATMKPVRLATQVAYVCGYAKGMVTEEQYGG
jgi:glycosyltransferase involved in cell wall biosynthesis